VFILLLRFRIGWCLLYVVLQLFKPAAAVGATLATRHNCCLLAQQGFLRSWQASGFQKKVIDRISEIILSLKDKNKDVRVFVTGGASFVKLLCPFVDSPSEHLGAELCTHVTVVLLPLGIDLASGSLRGCCMLSGHSLGGALATLAAHDIATAVKCLPKMALSVYTFGAPRVGNHGVYTSFSVMTPLLNVRTGMIPSSLSPCPCQCVPGPWFDILCHTSTIASEPIGRMNDFRTVDLQPSHARSASVCRSYGMSSMTRCADLQAAAWLTVQLLLLSMLLLYDCSVT
jgi:Lipase (class 3)